MSASLPFPLSRRRILPLPALALLATGCQREPAGAIAPDPTEGTDGRGDTARLSPSGDARAPRSPDAAMAIRTDGAEPSADVAPVAETDALPGGDSGDAGRDDAGGGAGDDGPAAAGSCSGARLCDDFEAYTPGARPGGGWQFSVTSGATLVVDGAKAWSGTKSIAITAGRNKSTAFMFKSKGGLFPLPNNDLYGRMMVFLEAAPVGGVHWNNVRAHGPGPDGKWLMYSYGGMNEKFMANYNPHDCWRQSKVKFPVGRWACLTWQFDGSDDGAGGRKNASRIWVDGAAIPDATVVRVVGTSCIDGTKSEWLAPVFDTIRFGWEHYQTSPIPIALWIDDVAVDDEPIPCPTR